MYGCMSVCLSVCPHEVVLVRIHAARRLTPPTTPHHTTPHRERDGKLKKRNHTGRQIGKQTNRRALDEEHSAHDATTVSVCSACGRVRVCVHKRMVGRWKPRGNVATLALPPINVMSVSQCTRKWAGGQAGRQRAAKRILKGWNHSSSNRYIVQTQTDKQTTHPSHTLPPSLSHPTAPRPLHTPLSPLTRHVKPLHFTSCLAGPYLPSLSV